VKRSKAVAALVFYAVEERRITVEWRRVGEFGERGAADSAAALRRQAGDTVRVKRIPIPFVH